MKQRTLQVCAAAAAFLMIAVPAAAQIGGCNVRMLDGYQWITCFSGSTACTTVWDGSTLILGPKCEKVTPPPQT